MLAETIAYRNIIHHLRLYSGNSGRPGTSACRNCQFASGATCAVCPNHPRTIFKKAQLPLEYRYPFLKHSYTSPSTDAQVINAKYVQAIPLDRQGKKLGTGRIPNVQNHVL